MADDTPVSRDIPALAAAVASAVPAGILTPSGVSTPGGPATGTVTPALSELPPDQIEHSLKVSLADLCAKAAVLYSQQKNYEEAAEVYARAAEIQAEMNGETDPENAEILFFYGRALFKVGQSKSDVLGGKAPEGTGAAGAKTGAKTMSEDKPKAAPIADAIATAKTAGEAQATKEAEAALDAKKPLFQFAGDEEWDASEEEDAAEGENEEDGDEDEDDLAVAFEVLDLSRVLFEKQLDKIKAETEAETKTETEPKLETTTDETSTEAKGKAVETEDQEAGAGAQKLDPATRHIMERLADTHDLLAEISLENERYPNAIVDSRASLAYKQKFLPEESEIVAEAHFKLSLALEFASVTTSTEGEGDKNDKSDKDDSNKKEQQVDQELRDEAARELEAAIASTRLKLQNREVELATMHSPEDNESTRHQIVEVKEIIADMEQRLVDLKKPPIDLEAAVNGPAAAVVGGLLGAFGSKAAGGSASVEEAKKGAKDLTGLVRRKAKDAAPAPAPAPAPATTTTTTTETTTNGNGIKRKAEDDVAGEDDAKKVRTAEE